MEDIQALRFLRTFNLLADFKCFPAIDEMFYKLWIEDWSKESVETNKTILVTFLRGCYLHREEIPHYSLLLKKACTYLEEVGDDYESILRGLPLYI